MRRFSLCEVAIVTWEDGICLSEVARRPFAGLEEAELYARRAAARRLAGSLQGALDDIYIGKSINGEINEYKK